MALSFIGEGIAEGIESAQARLSGLFETTIRLGVTGLSRAGKTVFVTGLVANLLARGRMPQLVAAREGRIAAAWLQPQPDLTLPRFDYERHLAALLGEEPRWPEGTRGLSELRLSLRLNPSGWFAGWRGARIVHLDIIDYPGEWLLDVTLIDKGFAQWSGDTLARLPGRPEARGFLATLGAADPAGPFDELQARALARAYADALAALRAQGYADCTPGRFLLPGDLAGSPVLAFAPMARPERAGRNSLWREMERRYDAYRARVAAPFFREHFARIDRQVVLIDVLGAIHAGPAALEETRRVMAEVLSASRVGRTGWLAALLGARRAERILFAATRADHLHHEQHPALAAITAAMVGEAKSRAEFAGAEVAAMAIAGFRATVEEMVERDGIRLGAVRGRLLSTGREAVMYPGALPDDPSRLLIPARAGAGRWLDADFGVMEFAPARIDLRPGEGPPHIRLDRALEFLVGDRL